MGQISPKDLPDPVRIDEATLYCGDCLDIMSALRAGSIEMIWTDPPYGHKNQDGDLQSRLNVHEGRANAPIANDTPDAFREVMDSMLTEASRILESKACVCCCCAGGGGPRPTFAWLADRMDRAGLTFYHAVVWDKKNPGLGWRYRRQYEFIMVAHRASGGLLWNDVAAPQRNIISIVKSNETIHPNEKPLGLVRCFIHNHSTPGQMILDPFMGAGTTGVACVTMGRKFIGIELDPGYFEVACRRIEEAARQGDLFTAPPSAPKQLEF